MGKRMWKMIPIKQLLFFLLAVVWMNSQSADSRDTYRRFKRWSTTMLAKPVEQHECKSDSDCSSIPNTSCAADPIDKRQKCLCADSSSPIQGECRKLPKALRTPCAADIECLPGAECVMENEDSKFKVCSCREDYEEVNNTCSGCDYLYPGPMAVALGASFTYWRLY